MIDSDPQAPRAQVPPAEAPGLAALLSLAVGVVTVAALYLAREVLVPIMLAVLLSFILSPVVELLHRLRLPRLPAVIVAVMIALGLFATLATVIGTQVASLAADAPRYVTTIEHKVRLVRNSTVGRLPGMLRSLGMQLDRASGGLATPVRVTTGPR
ncbi:MAG: AI-2E family transporter, partial [Sphingomonadaceae bacterium]|nr:AI-2E family transporter [Sphingomonadaceae bacterium]